MEGRDNPVNVRSLLTVKRSPAITKSSPAESISRRSPEVFRVNEPVTTSASMPVSSQSFGAIFTPKSPALPIPSELFDGNCVGVKEENTIGFPVA